MQSRYIDVIKGSDAPSVAKACFIHYIPNGYIIYPNLRKIYRYQLTSKYTNIFIPRPSQIYPNFACFLVRNPEICMSHHIYIWSSPERKSKLSHVSTVPQSAKCRRLAEKNYLPLCDHEDQGDWENGQYVITARPACAIRIFLAGGGNFVRNKICPKICRALSNTSPAGCVKKKYIKRKIV
jgi:hypothetical protein